MTDLAKRNEIVPASLAKCSECGFIPGKAKEVKNSQCRISAVQRFLNWGGDEEPEAERIRKAVKNMLDELYPKLEKLELVLKPVCALPGSGR